MNLDFEKSLVYITKDPGWANKLFAGAGIWLASYAVFLAPFLVYIAVGSAFLAGVSFFVSFFVSLVLNLVITGYYIQTANRRINFANSFLPDWNDIKHFAVTGLKYFCGIFLYFFPLLLFSCIYFCLLFQKTAASEHFFVSAFLAFTLFGALLLMLYILTMIFCPLMMANYMKNLKILSFVDFKSAFSLLKNNVGNYFVVLLLFVALAIFLQIIVSLLVITVIGIVLIPVVYFYMYLVAAEIIAQFVIVAKDKEQG